MNSTINLSFTGWHLVIVLFALAILIGLLMRLRTLIFRRRVRVLGEKLEDQKRSVVYTNIELSRANAAMRQQTRALEAQKASAEAAHTELQSSINYAQRIQKRLLASDQYWMEIGREYFVYYQPKESVGGDFYWAFANKYITCWAVGDCTGHGVPGALMSMLGVSFLTDIVAEGGETEPSFVLDLLRSKIIHILNQTGNAEEDIQDGMDIGFCVLDRRTRTVHFAGANHSLYLVREAEREAPEDFSRQQSSVDHTLYEFKGDRFPVGRGLREHEGYHTQSFPVWTGDTLYLWTDGLTDQLGGPRGKKFMVRRLKQWVLDHQQYRLSQQKELLDRELAEWTGGSPIGQVDDICLAGVRM